MLDNIDTISIHNYLLLLITQQSILDMFNHCCGLGMRLPEFQTYAELQYFVPSKYYTVVGTSH
jgi:hypothetical protein